MARKIAISLSRAMRISPPTAPKTFLQTSSMLPEFQALESWFPYTYCGESHQFYRDLITSECQLAELAWEASWFFALSEDNLALPDYHATKEVYSKILAWNVGRKQRLLLNNDSIPAILVLE